MPGGAGFDHREHFLTVGVAELARVERLAHRVDQHLGDLHLVLGRGLARREIERGLIDDLVGEMHQFQDQRVAVGFERGEMFLGADHDLGHADLIGVA